MSASTVVSELPKTDDVPLAELPAADLSTVLDRVVPGATGPRVFAVGAFNSRI